MMPPSLLRTRGGGRRNGIGTIRESSQLLMIMRDAMNMLWMILGSVGFCTVLLVFGLLLRQQKRQLLQAQKRIDSLSSNLSALCSGAVGVDRRLARLERNSRDLKSRQENFEAHGQVEQPTYGDAIRLVRQGASAQRLVEDIGLSRSEADLIVMLHGLKQAS